MTQFAKLFEPGRIGKLQLKNRIIMAPMASLYITEDGGVSERMINYYAERARGGCGLVMVEAAFSRPGGYPGRVNIGDDSVIPGLRRLAKAIHNGGTKAAIQILPHRGRADAIDPASTAEVTNPVTGIKARAVSIGDLKKVEDELGEGARRAKEAGFDCIGIHGAHGFLISDFLSPRTNRRTDDYGGDIKNRARFAQELVAAVKEKVGTDYPVIFRLSGDERMEGGYGVDEAIVFCQLLEEAGCDAVDIDSGGEGIEAVWWGIPYMYMPPAINAHLSQAIKKEVKIPVCVAGKITDPNVAEGILRESKADFVDLGRALIADPEFPNKVMAGRLADIRRCLTCCRCLESIQKPPVGPVICTVNPAVGREKEFELGLKPAAKQKRVLIIGGGPGGMEAAIIAAHREHDVTLWEKDDRLGGQLNIAVVPPGKEDLKNLLEYLTHRLDESKVTVELRKEATAEAVLEFSPDVVIVAVGSKPLIPEIKGIERRKVVNLRDVLSGKVDVGKRIAIVGAGILGCETADFLAEKGKKVAIMRRGAVIADELFLPYSELIARRLKEKGVEVFTGIKGEEITDKGMEIMDKDGKEVSLEVDDIVLAAGAVPDKTLFESLKGKVSELYEVGDCVEARRIQEAISEGATVGLRI